jgi:hypothetical protein
MSRWEGSNNANTYMESDPTRVAEKTTLSLKGTLQMVEHLSFVCNSLFNLRKQIPALVFIDELQFQSFLKSVERKV